MMLSDLRTTNPAPRRRPGFTLIEALVVVLVMAVLIAMTLPMFHRSFEQNRADLATANLQSIWAAQKLHWLEYRAYSTDLTSLVQEGLLDASIAAGSGKYTYSVIAADANTFLASATRNGSGRWQGAFSIDQNGVIRGEVQAVGEPTITPGFE